MSEILSKLSVVETLLRKYGNYALAEHVANGRKKLAEEGPSAYSILADLRWWGGSGSIADVSLYFPGRQFTDEQKNDNRSFWFALIDVQSAMEANGVRMGRAESWAQVFRKWKEQGI
jgi:hypothetical protein